MEGQLKRKLISINYDDDAKSWIKLSGIRVNAPADLASFLVWQQGIEVDFYSDMFRRFDHHIDWSKRKPVK